jgi:anaphase-promoting complex subunit 8
MNAMQIERIFANASESIRGELREALSYLSANRLLESAKWVGELLISLPQKTSGEKMITGKTYSKTYIEEFNESSDTLGLARALFDLREYRKCAALLKPFANPKYQPAMFLYYYASYLLSEQACAEEIYESGGNSSLIR